MAETTDKSADITTNVLLSGVGGQGIILIADIIARSAMLGGCDVKSYGDYGMARRGGAVSAQVRFGRSVDSPVMLEGNADMLISLELSETVRNAHMLKKDARVITNKSIIPPAGAGPKATDDKNLVAFLNQHFRNVHYIDGNKITSGTGIRTLNIAMLGCACASGKLNIKTASVREAIAELLKPNEGMNIKAFEAGYSYTTY